MCKYKLKEPDLECNLTVVFFLFIKKNLNFFTVVGKKLEIIDCAIPSSNTISFYKFCITKSIYWVFLLLNLTSIIQI